MLKQLMLPLYLVDAQLTMEALRLAAATRSPRSLRGYASDWKFFCAFAADTGQQPLPAEPETVALFLTARLNQGLTIATCSRSLSAIRHMHRIQGLDCHLRGAYGLLRGAQRLRGERTHPKAALTVAQVRAISARLAGGNATAIRDLAVILFGFATALRRSNLVALNLEDLDFGDRGVAVDIRRSKTDQEGRGRIIAVPFGEHSETCPVLALTAWLKVRGGITGPVFTQMNGGRPTELKLNGNRIAIIVQRAAAKIGLDPREIGAHSLRAGYCTEALANGANEIAVAQQTGHRSLGSLRRYYRPVDPFRGSPNLGL